LRSFLALTTLELIPFGPRTVLYILAKPTQPRRSQFRRRFAIPFFAITSIGVTAWRARMVVSKQQEYSLLGGCPAQRKYQFVIEVSLTLSSSAFFSGGFISIHEITSISKGYSGSCH